MARRKGQSSGATLSGFGQRRDVRKNPSNNLVRSMAGKAGNTGQPDINMAAKRIRAAGGSSGMNFYRRRHRKRDAAQRPFVSSRQYAQTPMTSLAAN